MNYTRHIMAGRGRSRPPNRRGNIIVGWYVAAIFALALAIPEDVLTTVPALERFTDLMASIVPSIDTLTARSEFPQVTRLFFSTLWATMPIQVALCRFAAGPFSIENAKRKKWISLLFVFVITPTLVYFMMFVVGQDTGGAMLSRRLNEMTGASRVGLAIGGYFVAFGVALPILLSLLWFRNVPQIYLKSSGQGDKYK